MRKRGTTIISKVRIILVGLLVSALVAVSLPQVCADGIKGDSSLLTKAADRVAENLSAIITWQGRVEIVDSEIRDGKTTTSTTTTKFEYESDGNQLRFDSVTVQPNGTYEYTAIRTRDSYSRLGPWEVGTLSDQSNHYLVNTLLIGGLNRESPGVGSPDFDPFIMFKISGRSPDKFLRETYDHRDQPRNMSVSRFGSMVKITQASEISPWFYEFDMEKASLPVSVRGGDKPDRVRETWKLSYVNVDGVFLPSRLVYTNKNPRRATESERIINVVEQTINSPIDPSRFDPMKIELQPGDVIRDLRDGSEKTFKREEFISKQLAERYENELAAAAAPNPEKMAELQSETTASPLNDDATGKAGPWIVGGFCVIASALLALLALLLVRMFRQNRAAN